MEKRHYKRLLSMNGVRIHVPIWVAKTKEILMIIGVGIGIFVSGILFEKLMNLFP